PVAQTGLYRVSCYVKVTRSATTSSSVQPTLQWTDGQDNQAMNANWGAANTGNTLTSFVSNTAVIWAQASTNVIAGVTYASVGGTSMQYEAHWTIVKL